MKECKPGSVCIPVIAINTMERNNNSDTVVPNLGNKIIKLFIRLLTIILSTLRRFYMLYSCIQTIHIFLGGVAKKKGREVNKNK